jgi:hypothetical protein
MYEIMFVSIKKNFVFLSEIKNFTKENQRFVIEDNLGKSKIFRF